MAPKRKLPIDAEEKDRLYERVYAKVTPDGDNGYHVVVHPDDTLNNSFKCNVDRVTRDGGPTDIEGTETVNGDILFIWQLGEHGRYLTLEIEANQDRGL